MKKLQLTIIFAIFAIVFSLIYMVVRTVLVFYADYTFIEKILGIILVLGEIFILVHGIGYALNIIKGGCKKSEVCSVVFRKGKNKQPSVAVLISARNEPKEVLENTFIVMNNLDYDNKTIYFLDDSVDDKYKKEAEELSKQYNLTLFRRTKPWHGAKAGVINDCLETLKEDYIAVFDADQNPLPDFIGVLVTLLEQNKELAFVQTPQFYSNIEETNPIARGAAFQQAVFYEYICEGKSCSNSMFCCGTNVMFRAEALKGVGGFDESTITEDFATSLRFHTNKWKSLYYPHVYAFGMGPESLSAYFQQQFRWAAGTITVLKKVLKQFFRHPFSLSFVQWIEYFLSSTYYFVGIAFYILMICPVLYILFEIPSFFAKPFIYFFTFVPYIILSMGIFYLALRKRKYAVKDLFLGQLLGIAAFPVYIKAAISALFGFKLSFGVTSKSKTGALSYFRLWPQMSMISISLIAVVWGINRFIYELNAAILVNTFWIFYHMCVMSTIFYLNKE
jgi:cellulose synthase (UDP-forming)